MQCFRPWDNTVRILTGVWVMHPLPRGESFAEPDLLLPLNVAGYQKVLTFLLFITLWLPKHLIS